MIGLLRSSNEQQILRGIASNVQKLRIMKGIVVRKLPLGSLVVLYCWAAAGGARFRFY